MRLIHEGTGRVVEKGMFLKDHDGINHIVSGWQEPASPGSPGRVFTQFFSGLGSTSADSAYFPSVLGCTWEEKDA